MNLISNIVEEHLWIDAPISTWHFIANTFEFIEGDIKLMKPLLPVKKISRPSLDGLWLFLAEVKGATIAYAYFDFRVKGGSFGKENSDRFALFLESLPTGVPLVLMCNSMGVRFMEGRTVFRNAFQLVPVIEKLKQKHLLITLAAGQCFGLGAVLFGMGHYRVASRDETVINLTGPEVFKLFFGANAEIGEVANAGIQHKATNLIDELVADAPKGLAYCTTLAAQLADKNALVTPVRYTNEARISNPLRRKNVEVDNRVLRIIEQSSDGFIELFPFFDTKLRAFIIDVDGVRVGILMNRVGNMDNLINTRTIALYNQCLALFNHLGLPLLTVVDTPGADPRMDGDNRHIIQHYIALARNLINYPHKKVGIAFGRLYGGASILAVPDIFGSSANYVVEETEIGVMHESIIESLVSGSHKLSKQWQASRESEDTAYSDLFGIGMITSVITEDEIRDVLISEFVKQQHLSREESHAPIG